MISGTHNSHGEIITLYNAGWCRSSSAVFKSHCDWPRQVLSCIGDAANMCVNSVVDLSVCERPGTCSDCGGY
jgi:hypothetical protein